MPDFAAPPSQFQISFAQVEQLRRRGRTADAERLCRQLLETDPGAVAVLNALAMLLADRDALEDAKPLLQRAIALAPREAVLHNNMGNLFYRQDDLPGAEAAYRKAVALRADYVDALYNLGVVVAAQERPQEALAAYRRAVAALPSHWQAQVQIAALLHQRGEHALALAALDAAGPQAQNVFDAQYYRGVVLTALARYADAIAALEKASLLSPIRFEARFALAGALAAHGREAEALVAYQHTIEMNPGYAPAHREYNKLTFAMGQDVRRIQTHNYARGKGRENAELLLDEAELLLRFNQAAEAEQLLRRTAITYGENAATANALGRALALQQRSDEAGEAFRRAMASEPEAIAHPQELGLTLLQSGKAEEARQILTQALALAPHNQATLAYLTLAARELGDGLFSDLFDAETLVREYELPVPRGFADAASFNHALAEQLDRLHTRRAAPLDQTLRGGTQTAPSLFARDVTEIGLLRDAIRECVADYIRTLPQDAAHPFLSRRSADFDFSGSWSCRLGTGGFHTNHIHEEGWISSAYYAALPDAVQDGPEGALKFGESRFALSAQDTATRFVRPKVGKLVLFPSYFWHGTERFTASAPRLAVAFDVMPAQKS